jgi:hypothetical protein
MLNDPRSHGLWEMTAPPAPETVAFSGKADADVVIVGGGYTGFSTALHLAERGVRVILLEGAEIGYGGSGRNVGLVNAGMWVMPDELPGVLGDLYGSRLLDLLGNAPRLVFDLVEKHAIDCEINPAGTLHCAVGQSGLDELKQRAEQWSRRGAPVRLLDAAETAVKVGTDAYAGALLDMRAGTIQPLAYARGLSRAAIAAGAQVFTGSPVTGAERDRKTLDGQHAARIRDGGLGGGRDQCLYRRALERGACRASPPALFQFCHGAALGGDAGKNPAGKARRVGHEGGAFLLPLRQTRPTGVRQRSARCAAREPAFTSPGPAAP